MIAINIPQTQYLISNRWTFEHPMRVDSAGKPMGPAVGIIGAAGAIGAGMSIGATTLVGGLMIAGGVASGIGALTGNKFLSNLGMGLGLAGGVGSFFQSATSGAMFMPGGESGMGFADSVAGKFFSDISGGIQNVFTGDGLFTGGGTGLPDTGVDPSSVTGLDTVAGAVDAETAANLSKYGPLTGGEEGGGLLPRLFKSLAPGESGGVPGGGLLGSKDFLSMISGGVDGYYEGEKLDLLKQNVENDGRLTDARIRQADFQTGMAQQQYDNMQYQNVSAPTANPNYSPATYSGPAQANNVVVDPSTGQIMRLTAEQYAQWQQQQGATA